MNYFLRYSTLTGKVLEKVATSTPSNPLNPGPDEAVIQVPQNLSNVFVDNGEVLDKTPSLHTINRTTLVADDVDTITISNLHNPTTVTWPDGLVTEETDGSMSFTIDQAGEYQVTLDAVPYLKEVIDVIATDPT